MIYILSITSWADRGMMADHFYGRIKDETLETVADLTHEIDPKDRRYWDASLWRALTTDTVETTTRFCTREEVMTAAKLWFDKFAQPGDRIISGTKTLWEKTDGRL